MDLKLLRYFLFIELKNGNTKVVSNIRDPMTHKEACTMKSKFADPAIIQLREYGELKNLIEN